jgi:hypothetical protein
MGTTAMTGKLKPADDARRLRREVGAGNPTKLLRLRCEAVTGNLT